MKINPLNSAIGFLRWGRDRDTPETHSAVSDKDPASQGDSGQQQKGRNPYQDQGNRPRIEVTEENVNQAIDAFHQENHTQANGLHASAEGKGPSIKVVLKDGQGSVIRQFTGEEFLKLRDAANQDARKRGKLLDQKL